MKIVVPMSSIFLLKFDCISKILPVFLKKRERISLIYILRKGDSRWVVDSFLVLEFSLMEIPVGIFACNSWCAGDNPSLKGFWNTRLSSTKRCVC